MKALAEMRVDEAGRWFGALWVKRTAYTAWTVWAYGSVWSGDAAAVAEDIMLEVG